MKIAVLTCDVLKDRFVLDMDNVTYVTLEDSLLEYDILINPLDEYINYDIIKNLIQFYNKGGIIINLSSYAYTVPYYLRDGVLKKQHSTIGVIRSFGMIDSYIPYYKEYQEGIAKATGRKYKYLEKYFDDVGRYYKICHLEHNLSRTNTNDLNDDEKGIFFCNRLENLVSLQNQDGDIYCSLISKTMEIGKGVMYNFNFDTSNIKLNDLLKEFLEKEYKSNVYVYAEPEFPRYQTDEDINLMVKTYKNKDVLKLKISVYNSEDENKCTKYIKIDEQNLMKISIPCQNEGLYKIVVEILDEEITLDIKETGVLVINEDSIIKECQNYNRIVVDKNISTEFHVQNGKTVPIHGTTYFVTDTMRRCFYHMNPYLCSKEIQEIRSQGYNIIRSGLWFEQLKVYGKDGEFKERSIRAMQTFFYIALKNNITVQFALGHIQLNEWDLESSVIHNPETRRKCMNMICNFLDLFKDYTNVQMEIVNEPSYSRQGAWKLARPTYNEDERKNYTEWLRKKYNNSMEDLCSNWGISLNSVKDFSDIELPKDGYKRVYYKTELPVNYVKLTDFFEFARESFSNWCAQIRDYARKIAPDMVVIMGCDETLRVPSEQEEFLNGNIDTINWHQWKQNSITFTEYLLNKVPKAICCGQEHGVYKYESIRNKKVLSEMELSNLLERKILYSLGNFVQWQWNNDPFMRELSEHNIGINRNDGSKMPVVNRLSSLMKKEDNMSKFEKGEELSNTKIFIVHPTSKYFSVDSLIAQWGVRTSIDTLVYQQKQHIYVILEHRLKCYSDMLKKGGNLLILPSAEVVRDDVWEELLHIVSLGNNVLITGEIERNNYWIEKNRIRALGENMKLMPVKVIEKVQIGEIEKDISFKKVIYYNYSPNIFKKCCHNNEKINKLSKFNIGKGKIYYYPLPVELADQEEVINDLYEYVIKDTNTQSEVFEFMDKKLHKNIFIYPQVFKECTVYTIINNGDSDTINFLDLRSNKEFEINVPKNRGTKLWIDEEGNILECYK